MSRPPVALLGSFAPYLLCIALGTGQSRLARAEDPSWNESYQTTVTPDPHDEDAFESARDVSSVTRRRLVERGVASSPEALEELRGIYLQRTNSAGGTPIVRGLLGQHVLLLVDGVRLNTAITRFGPNQLLNTVDPFALARIDVHRGPGSVLYGSDALGGVINLISQTPHFDPRRAWDLHGGALLRFESASTALISHAQVDGHVRGLGAHLGATFRRFGDLSGGRDTGVQRFTSYVEGDTDASIVWQAGAAGRLTLRYAGVRQLDAPRTDRASTDDFTLFGEQFRDLLALEYSWARAQSWLDQLQVRISYQLQRERRERFRLTRDTVERQRDQVGALGGAIAARSRLPYNALRYGIDLYHDRVGSSAANEAIGGGGVTALDRGRYVDRSTYAQLGGWAHDTVELGRHWAFELGGRLNAWIATVPADEPRGVSALDTTEISAVGSAHARYLVGAGLNLVAGVSQGYRAPNIDDYSALGCSGQGYDVPNPDLTPEKSVTAETGVKLDLWGVLRGSLFYAFTFLDDLIVRTTVPGAPTSICGTSPGGDPIAVEQTRRENGRHGMIHALEGQVDLSLARRWELFSWLAWTRGNAELRDEAGSREPLGRTPPLNGLAGVRYRAARQRWFAELVLRWATRQNRLSAGDARDARICPDGPVGCRGTAGYVTIGARGGWRLRHGLRLLFALDNISHETYRVHGSGIDGPGINARIGMELTL